MNKITFEDLLQARQLYVACEIAASRVYGSSGPMGQITAPRSIVLYCGGSACGNFMAWDIAGAAEALPIFLSPTGRTCRSLEYVCRHCRERWIRFEVTFTSKDESTWNALVHGIVPRQTPHISPVVERALSETDRIVYEKALRSRADGMGLGALAYLRRVVENAINTLLDLLAVLLHESEEQSHRDYIRNVEWLKDQKAFDKKAASAAAVLPTSFFAGGHNPFTRLHDWASVGVHNLDEGECCDVFDEIHGVFNALVERLEADKEARRLYAERLGRLSKRVPAGVKRGSSDSE